MMENKNSNKTRNMEMSFFIASSNTEDQPHRQPIRLEVSEMAVQWRAGT